MCFKQKSEKQTPCVGKGPETMGDSRLPAVGDREFLLSTDLQLLSFLSSSHKDWKGDSGKPISSAKDTQLPSRVEAWENQALHWVIK